MSAKKLTLSQLEQYLSKAAWISAAEPPSRSRLRMRTSGSRSACWCRTRGRSTWCPSPRGGPRTTALSSRPSHSRCRAASAPSVTPRTAAGGAGGALATATSAGRWPRGVSGREAVVDLVAGHLVTCVGLKQSAIEKVSTPANWPFDNMLTRTRAHEQWRGWRTGPSLTVHAKRRARCELHWLTTLKPMSASSETWFR